MRCPQCGKKHPMVWREFIKPLDPYIRPSEVMMPKDQLEDLAASRDFAIGWTACEGKLIYKDAKGRLLVPVEKFIEARQEFDG